MPVMQFYNSHLPSPLNSCQITHMLPVADRKAIEVQAKQLTHLHQTLQCAFLLSLEAFQQGDLREEAP